MKSKYIKSSEILEVNEDSLVVEIEFDTKKMVADFLCYADNITEIIKDLAERMEKRKAKIIKDIEQKSEELNGKDNDK